MTRAEFIVPRDLPDKTITPDIVWKPERGMRPNLVFRDLVVTNSLGLEVVVNGTYKPTLVSVTYNFVLRGTGPICRVDVNGQVHGNADRTHKHDLHLPEDSNSERNLPTAIARPDLVNKRAREVWELLCQQANIQHVGKFHDPS